MLLPDGRKGGRRGESAPRNSARCGGPKAAAGGGAAGAVVPGTAGAGDVPGAPPLWPGGAVPLGLEPSASGKRGGLEERVTRKVPFST